MYAGIALLVDEATQQLVQRLAAALAAHGGAVATNLAAELPAHISLKQPFACDDLPALRAWFGDLAARTAAVPITLTRLYHGAYGGNGILGLEVAETPRLRALHNQLNAELATVVADPRAPFDGDAYRFHLTIAMGPLGADDPYRAYVEALPDPQLNVSLRAERLALFICRAARPLPGTFAVEQVARLGERDNPTAD